MIIISLFNVFVCLKAWNHEERWTFLIKKWNWQWKIVIWNNMLKSAIEIKINKIKNWNKNYYICANISLKCGTRMIYRLLSVWRQIVWQIVRSSSIFAAERVLLYTVCIIVQWMHASILRRDDISYLDNTPLTFIAVQTPADITKLDHALYARALAIDEIKSHFIIWHAFYIPTKW